MHGDTFEEEMTWAIDSQIKVPPMHHTQAELVVTEKQYDAKFTVVTKFAGKVHVVITNTKDNNSFVQSIEGNIFDIVNGEIKNKGMRACYVSGKWICYETRGTCDFRYAVEQKVQLKQTPVEEETPVEDEEAKRWLWTCVQWVIHMERGRMPDSQSREPRFQYHLWYRFEVWAFSRSLRRPCSLSSLSEYLATNIDGNVSEYSSSELVSKWTGLPGGV